MMLQILALRPINKKGKSFFVEMVVVQPMLNIFPPNFRVGFILTGSH